MLAAIGMVITATEQSSVSELMHDRIRDELGKGRR